MMRQTLPAAQRLVQLRPQDPRYLLVESHVYSVMIDTVVTTDSGAALQYCQLQTQAMERALSCRLQIPRSRLDWTAYSQEARVWNTWGGLRELEQLFRRAVALEEHALERNPTELRPAAV